MFFSVRKTMMKFASFLPKPVLKRYQVVCATRKMLLTTFKYLFSLQRYANNLQSNMMKKESQLIYTSETLATYFESAKSNDTSSPISMNGAHFLTSRYIGFSLIHFMVS